MIDPYVYPNTEVLKNKFGIRDSERLLEIEKTITLGAWQDIREGNRRSQRLFIGDLAKENGYYLEWTNISKEEMIQISKNDNVKEVAKIFKENLKEVNQDLKTQNQLVQKIQAKRESKEQN